MAMAYELAEDNKRSIETLSSFLFGTYIASYS